MNKIATIGKKLLIYSLVLLHYTAWSQMPVCSGPGSGLVYCFRGGIYNHDPKQPYSVTNLYPNYSGTNPVPNTIPLRWGTNGVAIAPMLNSSLNYPTFYALVDDSTGRGRVEYHYYNGSSWVNTGHAAADNSAMIAGGGTCIYNFEQTWPQGAKVYKYSGTGNETLFMTFHDTDWYLTHGAFSSTWPGGWANDADAGVIQADCDDNLYVTHLGYAGYYGKTDGKYHYEEPKNWLRKYSSTGVLLHSWKLVGPIELGTSVIIGNVLIVRPDNQYTQVYKGIIDESSNVINMVPSGLPDKFLAPATLKVCAYNISVPTPDTIYYCGKGPGTPFSVSGGPPYSYNVLNGNATVTGNGPSYTVTATSDATIIVTSNQICATGIDTFHVIVPTATVNAGIDDTIEGCFNFVDRLHGALIDTVGWLTYNINWSPSLGITSGGNTLDPFIQTNGRTDYILTVSTPASQGGCTWRDTVIVDIKDLSPDPDFIYTVRYGCEEDTVLFQNLSTASISYKWSFDDGSIDTAINPMHIYRNRGIYTVMLRATNPYCSDTMIRQVDTRHELQASFTADKDTICLGDSINFSNTSFYTAALGGCSFRWDFGDGTVDTNANAIHRFAKVGVYRVRLIATDFVPCNDTAYHTIVVDSMPYLSFKVAPDTLCEGEHVVFNVDYLSGIERLLWNFGNGNTSVESRSRHFAHAYDGITGSVIVTATASYRHCPDISYSDTLFVGAYPVVDLGPDTSICPGQSPILLANLSKEPMHVMYKWSAGNAGTYIQAATPGLYWLQLTSDIGCRTIDSVLVKPSCYIAIPNVFTPNGDGVNDYFFPRDLLAAGISDFRMQIYNRWGQVIFETDRKDGRGWDGTLNDVPQGQGVFVYLIEVGFINGTTQNYKGNVTLMR